MLWCLLLAWHHSQHWKWRTEQVHPTKELTHKLRSSIFTTSSTVALASIHNIIQSKSIEIIPKANAEVPTVLLSPFHLPCTPTSPQIFNNNNESPPPCFRPLDRYQTKHTCCSCWACQDQPLCQSGLLGWRQQHHGKLHTKLFGSVCLILSWFIFLNLPDSSIAPFRDSQSWKWKIMFIMISTLVDKPVKAREDSTVRAELGLPKIMALITAPRKSARKC